MPTYNRLCAIRAEQIQREQWEQYPEIMQQIYGSPERSEPEQPKPEPAKPKQSKLFQVLSRLLK
jgi:hypothetical protein